jgi:hypothetical protein
MVPSTVEHSESTLLVPADRTMPEGHGIVVVEREDMCAVTNQQRANSPVLATQYLVP